MATVLNHGLIGFNRSRIGLRAPREAYSSAGKLTHASIHHGGPVGGRRYTFRDAQATILGWQRHHQDVKGWIDIGYNLLVDGLGRPYQGRPVGKLPAAVEGHNTGSVGVCFLQDGRYFELNVAQRRTLKVMFEHGIPKWGLPPLKRFATHSGSEWGVWGHQEYSGHESNECPGKHIMRHLDWRRARY